MLTSVPTRFAMLTDVGRVRAHNEDCCAADTHLGIYVVCDGMGGAAGGEIASREAAAAFLAHARQTELDGTPLERMSAAMRAANTLVYQHSVREPRLRGMGTTMVTLHLSADAADTAHAFNAAIVHAGDSRCYRLRSTHLDRITDDHSLVEEQVRLGQITADAARRSHLRNVITRVVGSNARVDPQAVLLPAQPGDLFLLCSDGLTRDLSDGDLRSILNRHCGNLAHAARVLVDAANLLGGGDNITVILVALEEAPAPADARP